MPQLNDQEANAWFGGNRPSNQQVIDDAQRYSQDPLALWWDTFITGKGTPSQVLGAQGGGAKPIRTPQEAAALAGSMNLNGDVRNADRLDAMARAGVAQGPRVNPYNTGIADQSRAAQLALINQMRGQMNGPSLAGLQGQRAMGQSGQQALGAAAMGAPGRAAMMQAGQVGQGMAGDMGQARLAEIIRAQAGMGGAAGNLRGADLRSAEAQAQAGLAQQRQDEALRQMYARLGMNLQNTRDQTAANRDITRLQLLSRGRERDMNLINNTVQSGGTVLGMGATGA